MPDVDQAGGVDHDICSAGGFQHAAVIGDVTWNDHDLRPLCGGNQEMSDETKRTRFLSGPGGSREPVEEALFLRPGLFVIDPGNFQINTSCFFFYAKLPENLPSNSPSSVRGS